MYNYDHVTAEQKRFLDILPYLFLSPEEQVNFHFMMHMRRLWRSMDFMADWESRLLQAKFEGLQRDCPWFDELDCERSFIPFREYDLSGVSRATFQRMISDPDSPPIIARGLLKHTKAVRKWTHQHLAENYKDVEIISWDYGRDGYPLEKVKLADIVAGQLDPRSKKVFYIANSAEIFHDYPYLVEEIGGDVIKDLFKGQCANSFSQIFVGNLKTWGATWHQGNDVSCAIMINGVKRWYFIDPRLNYVMRPYLDGSNGMGTQIDARFSMAFQKIHNPLFAYAPKLWVDIEPGDVIIFTKYWPHAVLNISPFQIMANMRMTELDQETMRKGHSIPNLQPFYDNILNSDPEFIKFKFNIFRNLGKSESAVGDSAYFSAFNSTKTVLSGKEAS